MLKRLNSFHLMAEEKTSRRLKMGRSFIAQISLFSFCNWANSSTIRPKSVLSLAIAFSTLSACALPIPNTVSRQNLRLTPAQTCAIGYDLAAQIYRRMVLAKTVIIPGAYPSDCEAHTLTYLKRAGFKIDETAPGPAMTVDLSVGAAGSVAAIATLTMTSGTMTGGTLDNIAHLRLGRSYRLADTGVYPQGAVSFITLPASARVRRPRAVSSPAPRADR